MSLPVCRPKLLEQIEKGSCSPSSPSKLSFIHFLDQRLGECTDAPPVTNVKSHSFETPFSPNQSNDHNPLHVDTSYRQLFIQCPPRLSHSSIANVKAPRPPRIHQFPSYYLSSLIPFLPLIRPLRLRTFPCPGHCATRRIHAAAHDFNPHLLGHSQALLSLHRTRIPLHVRNTSCTSSY
jgi:hypothetical protein